MPAMTVIAKYFERLALRVLTRNGQRAMVLLPGDSVLLIRNNNLEAIFPSTENPDASMSAVWLSALFRVGSDITGSLDMATAITVTLLSCDADPATVAAMHQSFMEEREQATVGDAMAIQADSSDVSSDVHDVAM